MRILGDQHLAEEVTQEVFLEIWLRPDRFDPRRGSGLSLLMSITHHKSVYRVRRSESIRRRDATHVDSSHHTPYDETVTSVTASLDAQWVQGALDVLSWQQREAIELAYFGGYTHTEVSSILDVPLGTTKSRIRDGLLRLRVQMVPAAA
ncbi:sigma-70 family RNA polymerase sigma factor [soil metagenome]